MKNVKRLILVGLGCVFLVGAVACSDSATAPTSTPTSASATTSTPATPSTTTPTPATPGPTTPAPSTPAPGTPAGNVTVTRNPANYSCNPNAALTPQVVSWTISVTNNPTPMSLTSLVFHSDKAGCDPTVENPRTDLFGINGPTSYALGATGQTTFTFNTAHYSCGRDQPDVRDLIGEVINHGIDCPPPPPPPLACAPPTQTVNIGQTAGVSATGGTGTYSWSAPGASIPTGTGTTFSTSYSAAGNDTITVTSGTQNATCQVIVPTAPPPPPTCDANVAPTLTVTPGPTPGNTFTALAGFKTGTGSINWGDGSAGVPITNGGSASHTYTQTNVDQTFSITLTVTSGTLTCPKTVTVSVAKLPLLVCTPPTQTVNIGVLANVSATGGTGNYVWTAPGSLTPTGTGSTFSASYPLATPVGMPDIITVKSGTQTATCQVIVPPPPPPTCESSVTARITSITPGVSARAEFTIPAGSGNVQVGFASYSALARTFELPQVLFDHSDQTLGPGVHDITIKIPNCYYQLDAYCGVVIPVLSDTDKYGTRIRATGSGGDIVCPVVPTP